MLRRMHTNDPLCHCRCWWSLYPFCDGVLDDLPVVAKQIPKYKVHRYGTIGNRRVPFEFVALYQVFKTNNERRKQLAAKFAESRTSDTFGVAGIEKRQLCCLTRTNVIRPIEVYERRSSYVLVMERLPNSMDLLEYLNSSEKPLTEPCARLLFKQVCNAARCCRRAGLYHRDFKDENIVLNVKTKEARLIDFGCAAKIESSPFYEVSGTPQFSSPEWWEGYYVQKNDGNKKLDKPWDGAPAECWSLGVMLYTMLHVKLPFATPFEIQHDDVHKKFNPNYTDSVKDLVGKLLNKDPKKRMTLNEIYQHPWFCTKST